MWFMTNLVLALTMMASHSTNESFGGESYDSTSNLVNQGQP